MKIRRAKYVHLLFTSEVSHVEDVYFMREEIAKSYNVSVK